MIKITIRLALTLGIGLWALDLAAQTNTNTASVLTATVYPGYVFGTTEPPSASKLNRLGLPTIRITGSLDGSSLAAGGVGNDNLASNAFDQVTIIGGHGSGQSVVSVNFDTNTLTIVNDQPDTNLLALPTLGVKTNAFDKTYVRTNSLDLFRFVTNWLDVLPVVTNWTVNLCTNLSLTNVTALQTNFYGTNPVVVFGSTNAWLPLVTSVQVDTNGAPTNTTAGLFPVEALAPALTNAPELLAAISNAAVTAATATAPVRAAVRFNGYPYVSNLVDIIRPVSSLVSTGLTATATSTGHPYLTNQSVNIAGATPAGYNGSWIITGTTANTFTYTLGGALTSPATGASITADANAIDIANDRVSLTNHSLALGQCVTLFAATTMPVVGGAALGVNTPYFAGPISTNSLTMSGNQFKLYRSHAEALVATNAIDFQSTGSGAISFISVRQFSAVNADVFAYTAGSATPSVGVYRLFYRTALPTTNNMLTGSVQVRADSTSGYVVENINNTPSTTQFMFVTHYGNNAFTTFPTVSSLITSLP